MKITQDSILKPVAKNKKAHPFPHIDMTPMVDVAMLLLTFFMLTAIFSKPLVIELNLPKGDVPIQKSKILNLWVDGSSLLYESHGVQDTMRPIDFTQLHDELLVFKKLIPSVVIRIKLDRQARYERLVDILDELCLTSIDRFGIVPLKKEEKTRLDGLAAMRVGRHISGE